MANGSQKVILSSTHIDSHGDQMSKEDLQFMVDTINGERKMQYNVEHRRDLPPKGRIDKAELIEKDGYYLVSANIREYQKATTVPWSSQLIIESFEEPFPFVGVESEVQENTAIFFDPHNFTSPKEAAALSNIIRVQKDSGIDLGYLGRKSVLPDPEIIFAIGKTFTLYHLLKPVAKKIGENIADEISEKAVQQSKQFLTFVLKCLKNIFHYAIPKTKPVCVVFSFSGDPQIELVARTRDEKLILKGLSEKQLAEVKTEVQNLSQNVSADKIQFLLSDKGKWKLNYLLTKNGETIGTKLAFQKRDRKIEMMGTQKRNKKG